MCAWQQFHGVSLVLDAPVLLIALSLLALFAARSAGVAPLLQLRLNL